MATEGEICEQAAATLWRPKPGTPDFVTVLDKQTFTAFYEQTVRGFGSFAVYKGTKRGKLRNALSVGGLPSAHQLWRYL